MLTLKGLIRRFGYVPAGEREFRLTQAESLAVAQVESPHSEMVRSGVRFAGGCQVIASGIGPVTAIPTTTATLALYNTSPDVSLVMQFLAVSLGSGTPTAGASLLLGLTPSKVLEANIPSAAANYSSGPLGLGAKKTSAARWGLGVTIPQPSWWVAANSLQLAAANVGQGDMSVVLDGGLIVPPEHALGIAILSGTGTNPLYLVSGGWDERELDLE